MEKNRVDLTKEDYKGLPSTLCKGCGHDSITNALTSMYFDLGIEPHRIAKFSGIGCSSKTPTYFVQRGFGFNAVHGRMPSVATGASLGNRSLSIVGVSGDGDSMSIGIGQFCHTIRRNPNMVYVIANNGTYGLTKGQFSATADQGVPNKYGVSSIYPVIDTCELAIALGATFVARTFTGDRKQMIHLLKAAYKHQGTAILDIISPCVTFNNHAASTKSYPYMKEHDFPIHEVGFVPSFDPITTEIKEGETKNIKLHDGSTITLKKLASEFDPRDKVQVIRAMEEARTEEHVITGLLYYQSKKADLHGLLNMVDTPLKDLKEKDLDPGPEVLGTINKSLK